jgi:multiple sugar transport system substrate-binding protein
MSAAGAWITDRRGRSGLIAGGAAGLATGLLLAFAGQPLLARDDELEPGELVIMSSIDESQGGQRQLLLDQWNALHGDRYPARIRTVNRSPEKAHAEMLEAGPDVDILNLDVTWTAEFVAADRIRALDEERLERLEVLDGFLDLPLRTCRYRDTYYALPFNTDAGLLYYRTYPRGGDPTWPDPPATWDDIRAAADEALGPGGDEKLEAGYVAQLSDSEILTVTALEAIWAAGGDVVDSSGAVVIDSEEAERGLRRLSDGLKPANRQLILPDSRTFDEKTSTKAFADGRAMAMRNWPVAYRDLQRAASHPGFRYQVTTVPGQTSVLGGQNLAVSRDSDQPRAAQALIEFLTGERSQQILFEHGGFAATRQIVYRDANIIAKYPYATTLLEAILRAQQRPVTPHYTDFSREFRKVVMEAWADDGEITPDHARRIADALQGRRGG